MKKRMKSLKNHLMMMLKNVTASSWVQLALVAVFFASGLLGVWNHDTSMNSAEKVYYTLRLFVMENDLAGQDTNFFWDIARFGCPVATVACVFPIVYALLNNLFILWKLAGNKLIAVHGDNDNIDLVVKNLGTNAVHSDRLLAFWAKRHILMFDDDLDMYRFLDEHGSELIHDEEKEIFLCSEKILRGNYKNKKLVVCNVAENCAREYWDKHPIRHKREKVLIIGFDNYGQRLFNQAVLKNVVDVNSNIQYYVVGDFKEYLARQHKLNKAIHVEIMDKSAPEKGYETYGAYEPICGNRDTVFFHKDMDWVDVMNLGIAFDRIILTDDLEARNLDVFNDLKTYYTVPECHIKVTDRKIVDTLWDVEKENIVVFGVNEEIYEPEVILKEKLFREAKMIHGRYFCNWSCNGLYEGSSCNNKDEDGVVSLEKCMSCPKFLEDWNSQSTFIRYSNVAAADHMKEKLRLVLGEEADPREYGIGKKAADAYRALPEERKKELWKIEHIRWDRYHFMNNWDYDPVRQNAKRLHHLLVPFEDLSEKEQSKDGDSYLAMEDILMGEMNYKGQEKKRKYNFKSMIDRRGMDALAVDQIPYPNLTLKHGYTEKDIIPMWVADMNFATVPTVEDAISQRLMHPCFGYFRPRDEYFSSIIEWHEKRHGVKGLTKECIGYENGVLGGLMSAVSALSEGKKEKILLHAPTYIGFTNVLTNNGYPIVHSYLKQDADGIWRMDFEDMEKKIQEEKIRIAIFCSPHNPCGRVWERWEIEQAMELYKKYDVKVISDEIWSDIVRKEYKHIPTQMVSEDAKMRTVALYAPSKTFNLAGLIGSYHIIYNEEVREKVRKEASFGHYNSMNVLSMYALIGAYKPEGHEWVDELCEVIAENVDYACAFIEENVKGVSLMKPEGTYMLFLDCEEWCKKHGKTLDELLLMGAQVGVIWQDGRPFHGEYSIRMNLALPKARVEEAFSRLRKYVFTKEA